MQKQCPLKSFSILLLTILYFPLFAQNFTIKGYVSDSTTGQALSAANIVLHNLDNHLLSGGTITNENGDFFIQKLQAKPYTVTISFLGYKTRQLLVEPTKTNLNLGNIQMVASPTLLNEIVVEWKPLLEYGDDSSVTLNLDMLGNLETLSVADAMESVPGFYFDFDDKPVYNGINNYTILINGEKMGRSFRILGAEDNYLYTLRNIPAKYIKKVEIFPEPFGKYGFYTPIINMVTNGNLRDVYNAHSGIGSNEKYMAGVNLSKKLGKVTLNPRLEYSNKNNRLTTNEDRIFENAPDVNNFSRESIQNKSSENGSAGFSIRHSQKAGNWIDVLAESNLFTNEHQKISRNTIYRTQSLDENESYYSKPVSYNSSVSLVRLFNLSGMQTFRVIADCKYNYSSKEEAQNLTDTYLQKNKTLNTNLGLKANYTNANKKNRLFLNMGFDYQNNYNFSERKIFDSDIHKWTSMTYYLRNNRLQRISSNIDFNVNRRFKNEARIQSIRFALSGIWNNDLVANYIKDKETNNGSFRTTNSLTYSNSKFLKQGIDLRYKYNVLWPSSDQLFSTPEYINEQTMRVGNPDLKPETRLNFTLRLRKGFDPSAVYLSQAKFMSWGYSFDCNYWASMNEIVSNQTLNGDNVVIQSYTNNDKHSSLKASGNFYYNFRNKIKLYMGGELTSENFSDNPSGYENSNNWNAYSKIRTKMFVSTDIELKYRYNSPRVFYRSKVHDFHDASVSLSRHLLKNNLLVQFEVTNILSRKGIRTEYFGDNFYSNTIVRNESPVIWLKASYVLFSFYSRKELN